MTKLTSYILLILILLLTTACSNTAGNQLPTNASEQPTDSTRQFYALACDGCNDTVVVVLRLPYEDSDPDTISVLEASRNRQVFGELRIGDLLVIVSNENNPKVADMVIDTENLHGQWCYQVLPTLRERPGDSLRHVLTDSVKRQLLVAREYGFVIKPDSAIMSLGFGSMPRTSDEESDIVYPTPRRYRQWYINEGRLLLTEAVLDSLGQLSKMVTDTARFVELTADTLVLQFEDSLQGYYRKSLENE